MQLYFPLLRVGPQCNSMGIIRRMKPQTQKILLVEDNPWDADLVCEMLAEANRSLFELRHVDRISAAITSLDEEDFVGILLDISLPDAMDLDSFSRVHASAPHLPIVILTGKDDENIAMKAVQSGAQDYLIKGKFDEKHLVRTITYAIERHRMRMELHSSELRLRTIIEQSADGILIVSQDGTIRFINPAGQSLLGRPGEELIGLTFGFPIIGEDTAELEIMQPNGNRITVEMRTVDTTWDDEKVILASLRDVTKMRQAEEMLKKRNRELALLNQSGQAMVSTLNMDEVLIQVLEELRSLLGVTAGSFWLKDEKKW